MLDRSDGDGRSLLSPRRVMRLQRPVQRLLVTFWRAKRQCRVPVGQSSRFCARGLAIWWARYATLVRVPQLLREILAHRALLTVADVPRYGTPLTLTQAVYAPLPLRRGMAAARKLGCPHGETPIAADSASNGLVLTNWARDARAHPAPRLVSTRGAQRRNAAATRRAGRAKRRARVRGSARAPRCIASVADDALRLG